MTHDPHASELARMHRQASSTPRPGSIEEAEALGRIDDARIEELNARYDTTTARRKRARRHWSDRGRQLGGI
jgi:hypothetical protein